ncbi:hypothetical protein FEM48_Zijuj08G0031000 [Ziziphus jujuba var. spinosa]|uniref:Caffeic acid 3-O-methyltransferase-like n=1 Tax=Ziziphus jujuba var. spinosa TaxID=714518 RepID=A0A978UWM3_ZIZJJ|nr:hypothetical protein FEM48_Zijuj08G0031000 [Ziziphus jujuba var. spinosa]
MASSLEIENNLRDHDHDTREEEEIFSYALQLVGSSALPMSLLCAIELGVFDIIGKAGEKAKLSPTEIAAQLGTNNPDAPTMLDSILRLLACHSVLNCSVVADDNNNKIDGSLQLQRRYSLAPVSRFFVTNKDGVSLGPLMSLTQDKVFLASWSQLKDAILQGGIPFNRVYGMHAFEYPEVDPRFNQVLNTAMYNHTTIAIKQILEVYKGFEHIKQLVDVGGGFGVTLKSITSTFPHIKGINFDLPLFPVKLETSAAVKSISQANVVMMTQNPGGKERTEQEFLALATASGFGGVRFECCVSPSWVMEFFK